MEKIISFIGAGSMGGALARGVCAAAEPKKVAVYAPTKKNTLVISKDTGCLLAETLKDAVTDARYVVLGMKPQVLPGALKEILPYLKQGQIIVSIAAGIKLTAIEEILAEQGLELPVIRIMPNTPVAIGKGVLLVARSGKTDEKSALELAELLKECGMVEHTSENFLDLGSPVMGCSPAFVYMFIEALADGGVKTGLTREKAQLWAAQAVLGSAAMVLESGMHPGELKDAVCSPGGTTIAGIGALEEHGFRAAIIAAVNAANKRNEELSK